MKIGNTNIKFVNEIKFTKENIIVFSIQFAIFLFILVLASIAVHSADIMIEEGVQINTTNISYIAHRDLQAHYFQIADDWLYFNDAHQQGYNYSIVTQPNKTIRIDSLGRYYSGSDNNRLEYFYMLESPISLDLNYSSYNITSYERYFNLNTTEDTDKSRSTYSNYSNNIINLNYSWNETGDWYNRSSYTQFVILASVNHTDGNYSVNLTSTGFVPAEYNDYAINFSNYSRYIITSFSYDLALESLGANSYFTTALFCGNGSVIYNYTRPGGIGGFTDFHVFVNDRFTWYNNTKYLAFHQNNTLVFNQSFDCIDFKAVAFFSATAAGTNTSANLDNFTFYNGSTDIIYKNSFENEYQRKYKGYSLLPLNYSLYHSNNITRLGSGNNFIPLWKGSANSSNSVINLTIGNTSYFNISNNTYYNISDNDPKSMYIDVLLIGQDTGIPNPQLIDFHITFNPLIEITFLVNDAITNESLSDLNISLLVNDLDLKGIKTGGNNISFLLIPEKEYNITFSNPDHASRWYYNSFSRNGTFQASIFKRNSLWINFLNISSGESIFDNVTVRLTGPEYYENNTNESYAYVEDLSPGNYTITALSDNYQANHYKVEVSPDSFQYINIYLISIADASSVTFTTMLKNSDSVTIEGVILSVQKYVNGSLTVVSVLETDVTGRTIFYYETGELYKFYAQKEGYKLKNFTLDPILFTSYTIRMEVSAEYSDNSDYANVIIIQEPTSFRNNNYNVSMTIASASGSLVEYGFNITYGNTTYSDMDLNVYGAVLEIPLSLVNASYGDTIRVSYYYQTASGARNEYIQEYTVDVTDPDNPLWATAKDSYINLSVFDRAILVTIVLLVFAGAAYFYTGDPSAAGMVAMLIIGVFVYSNVVPYYVVAIAAIVLLMMLNFRGNT